MAVVGELVAGRYQLEELIGAGGMSSVYRAYDEQLDRRVALKILHEHFSQDEDYVERFRREARAVAQLSHPNIVTVIDRGESDGRQFIVFEYVEGENLKQCVTRTGPLTIRAALELAIQVGRALAFAHEHGLVHRDVKPQNVLLGNGRAKVTDFGIARTVNVHGLTQTGTVLGSSDYIAPEQASGHGASQQSDVYSLGVVLFELLTGEVPYTGDNFIQVAYRHVNDPVPSVLERRPDTPLRVVAAVERALEKDVADRFPTMHEFVAELEACLAELGGVDRDPTLIIRTPPELRGGKRLRPKRRLLPVALVVLLLAAAGGAAAVYQFVLRHHGVTTGGKTPTASAGTIHLRAAAAYDPQGDGQENDDMVRQATDGSTSTYWATEHYATQDFGNLKQGVGLVVDAGKAVKLDRLVVVTDTPGFDAEIEAGSAKTGPFDSVSGIQKVTATTTFTLHLDSARRYYLLWLTKLAPGGDRFQTHVNEVRAG